MFARTNHRDEGDRFDGICNECNICCFVRESVRPTCYHLPTTHLGTKSSSFTMPTWVSRGATLGSHCGMSSIYVKVQTAVRFFEFKFYVTNAGLNGDTSSTGKRVQQVVLSWCQQSMVNRGNCAIFAHPYGTLMR